MKRRLAPLVAVLMLLVVFVLPPQSATAATAPLELTAGTRHASLEGRLEDFADPTNALPFEAVRQRHFTLLPKFRSLGYDTDTHWFHFELNRTAGAPTRWIVAIGMPDLQKLDVWVQQPKGGFRNYALGCHRPYASRPLKTRLFAVPVDVTGPTNIYFRVQTTNAINVNAGVWRPDAFVANETHVNFYYGLYFGILLIAVVLYSILGAWMRDVIMAAYAGYVASMALLNIGSIGYLPVLFASPDAPWLTDALPRIGWLGGAIFIVLMWDRLLELKRNHPHIHRLFLFTIILNLALLPFALMPSWVTSAILVIVKFANYLNSLNFFISMALLLVNWWRSRRAELMLYFVAFVIPAIATLVNTAANQGVLVQNELTAYIYQIAPLVHVFVMSFGLALRLRKMQKDKVQAEQKAMITSERASEQRRFVAMLSHEFRNPLAAIDRSAQMIQIKAPELAEAEARRLTQIRTNVATLSGFVDNFLMTEALEHGALALSRKQTAIRPLLEAAGRIQGKAEEARIHLTVSPEKAVFLLDPTLIGIAVGNLVGNALRYSPPESPVEVDASLDDTGLHIRVADHGPGMDKDEMDRLGTPYFRAGSSHGKDGTGLGYHFTERIVQAHGGTLSARSEAGQGMAVEMLLP